MQQQLGRLIIQRNHVNHQSTPNITFACIDCSGVMKAKVLTSTFVTTIAITREKLYQRNFKERNRIVQRATLTMSHVEFLLKAVEE